MNFVGSAGEIFEAASPGAEVSEEEAASAMKRDH
jgi:hypothetical protein